VRRHRHHRAGAVLAEHEVRDPDRHRLVRERVDRAEAGVEPCFSISPLMRRARSCSRNACACCLNAAGSPTARQRLHERMLGPSSTKVAPKIVSMRVVKTSIASRIALERELHARAFRPPDPVPLHRQNLLGPLRQRVGASSSSSA
jgi:hypothetical protein